MVKKRAVLAVIVTLIVVGSSTFGILMFLDRRDYRIFLGNQYLKNLYEVMTNVEGIQVSLSKVAVTSTPEQSSLVFGEIWRQASAAQDKINTLPVDHSAIASTSRFLTQLGDFSYSLLKSINKGGKVSDADFTTIETLKKNAEFLNTELHDLERSISEGKLNWGEIKDKGRTILQRQAEKTVDIKFQKIAEEVQKYPSMIYDGPFSENALNIKPKVLDEKEIDVNRAKEIVTTLLGKDRVIDLVQVESHNENEKIPSYGFDFKFKDNNSSASIDISKNGGHVVYYINPRGTMEPKLDVNASIKKGREFLKSMGYDSMIPTYSLRYDNILIVNYVYVSNNVVVYPDQIKLKIGMDNGEVLGIESQQYLIAHTNRSISKPVISLKDARKNVNKNINVKSIRLTLIPMESVNEVLCYEFLGDYKGEKYIVYINALDGSEERILKIIETPNGELTM